MIEGPSDALPSEPTTARNLPVGASKVKPSTGPVSGSNCAGRRWTEQSRERSSAARAIPLLRSSNRRSAWRGYNDRPAARGRTGAGTARYQNDGGDSARRGPYDSNLCPLGGPPTPVLVLSIAPDARYIR